MKALANAVMISAVKDMKRGILQDRWTAYNFLTAATPNDARMLEFWCTVGEVDEMWIREQAGKKSAEEWMERGAR